MPAAAAAADPDPAGLVWLESILEPVISISIFGGSILFSLVVGGNDQTHAYATRFQDQLPTFLALAWFFFVLALGLAIATKMALPFARGAIRDAFADPTGSYEAWAARHGGFLDRLSRWIFVKCKMADVLCLLVLLAFFFMSLCVAAYNVAIGSLAAACTGITTLLFVVTWIIQNF